MERTLAKVIGLYTGQVAERWDGKPPSAIGKSQVDGGVFLGPLGLEGDEQADLIAHGGPDQALHQYPADHYAFWRETFPEQAAQFVPGAFGENLSAEGMTEADICLGDVIGIGEATVQVTRGRSPCWKLAAHMQQPKLAYLVQKTCRTGWYYRVLQPGEIRQGDALRLLERPQPDWPMDRAIAARFNPRLDSRLAAELAAIPEAAEKWRQDFAKKTDSGFVEDQSSRLQGPPPEQS